MSEAGGCCTKKGGQSPPECFPNTCTRSGSEPNLDAGSKNEAVNAIIGSAAIGVIEVDIDAVAVDLHALGQLVTNGDQVLIDFFVAAFGGRGRTGDESTQVVVTSSNCALSVALVLAVEVSDREAPGAGDVGSAQIIGLAVMAAMAVAVLLGVGTTDGEAAEAEVKTTRPNGRIGARVIVAGAPAARESDIETADELV